MDSLPTDIYPNYHKTVAEVFSDFTKWWIVKHQSLRILSAVHTEFGRTWQETSCIGESNSVFEEGRPSWSLWYRGHSNWANSILGLSTTSKYCAAADTVPDIDMIIKTQERLSLPLAGVRISTIEKVMPYPYYKPQAAEYQDLHDVYNYVFDPFNEKGNWIRSLYSQGGDLDTLADNSNNHPQHRYSHLGYAEASGAIQCRSDCFFKTPDGLVGLCPPFVRSGDLVVVLYGGKVPYIIRPRRRAGAVDEKDTSSIYEFVGECYLQ